MKKCAKLTGKPLLHSLNINEWTLIGAFLAATFANSITINSIDTYYPKEAISRGIDRGKIGIVIGIYQLSRFFMAPIIGNYIVKIGINFAFYSALFIVSGSAISLGFLTFLNDNFTFFCCSLVIRFFQAIGRTFFVLSIFTLSAQIFPDHLPLISSILETFEGVGHISGPIFGTTLYEIGGFKLPNFVMGTTMALLAFAFVTLAPLPPAQIDKQQLNRSSSRKTSITTITGQLEEGNIGCTKQDKNEESSVVGYSTVLRHGKTWMVITLVLLRGITNSFYQPSLPTHLKSLSPSAMLIGIMSTIMSVSYLLSSPVWGLLIEKRVKHAPKLITLAGSVMAIGGVSLLGPIPFIPIKKSLQTMCISFSLLGMATSALYIPVFKRCSNISKKLIDKDDNDDDDGAKWRANSTQIYACIFALVQSASTLGSFFGSIISGFGSDAFGFPWICAAVAFAHLMYIILEQICRILAPFVFNLIKNK